MPAGSSGPAAVEGASDVCSGGLVLLEGAAGPGVEGADAIDGMSGDAADTGLECAFGGSAGGALLADIGAAAGCCLLEAGPLLVRAPDIGPMDDGLPFGWLGPCTAPAGCVDGEPSDSVSAGDGTCGGGWLGREATWGPMLVLRLLGSGADGDFCHGGVAVGASSSALGGCIDGAKELLVLLGISGGSVGPPGWMDSMLAAV